MGVAEIRAGKAFVEIFLKGTGAAGKQLDAFAAKFKAVGGAIRAAGQGLAGFGVGMAGRFAAAMVPLGLAVKKAADLDELQNKFEAVFGDLSAAAGKWAGDTADAVKRSKAEIQGAMSTYQAFFVGMGFARKDALELSKAITNVALDLASFHNIDDAEATERLLAAMSGSSEVLDQFGINIKEAAVGQELLRSGIAKSSAAASEGQKAIARLAIIQRAMSQQGAAGDAAKTSGSFVNQMKGLKAAIGQFAAVVGKALIPVLQPLVAKIREAAVVSAWWIGQNQGLVVGLGYLLAGGLAASVGMVVLGKSLAGVGLGITLVGRSLALAVSTFRLVFSTAGLVVAAFVAVGAAILTWNGAGATLFQQFGAAFAQVGQTVNQTIGGIVNALKAGDVALAAQILWAGVKLAFFQGVEPLRRIWTDFKLWITQGFGDLWVGAQAIWATGVHAVVNVWAEGVLFIRKLWNGLKLFIADTLDWITNQAAEVTVASTAGAGASGLAKQLRDQQEEKKRQQRIASVQRELEAGADIVKAEQEAKALQAGNDATLKNSLAALAGSGQSNNSAAKAAADLEEFDSKLRIQRLKMELAQLTAAAAAKGSGVVVPGALGGAPDVPDIAGIKAPLDEAKNKDESRGTFNARAIQSLQGAGVMERVAESTKRTADNTRQLVDNLRPRVYGP